MRIARTSRPQSALAAALACMLGFTATAADAGPQPAHPHDPVAGRGHWAFQPLSATPPKPLPDDTWSRSAIDQYLFEKLREANLRPAPDAGPRDLLRRVYYQLIGLPPTPEEMTAFLADTRPGAFERVVDRLLNSPRFGERWGRHWLDLARYADSNGLDENFLFREAWRYRNWVIDAVNADLPFDRFLLEQIAGDLLPFQSVADRDRQRIAAGFLVIGPKVLLGNNPKNQRMEVADEQIDTIGRALLGLTLGCARCHDHKFEPVPTADYYALAGILTSTRVMEKRYMLGEQRVMEQLVGLGSDGDALDSAYEKHWRELPQLRERAKNTKAALELLEKPDLDGLQTLIEKHPDAAPGPVHNARLPIEDRIRAQQVLVKELAAAIAHPPPIPPRAMIPSDADSPADETIRLAGQFDRPGEPVPRGFPRVLHRQDAVEIPEGQSGRLQLGRWLTDADRGAGHLTARVMANRVWHHLIGRGIVRTVDNFGRTGEPPSHPELLDHLATRFVDSGWSLKTLVREIALSRAFAMSTTQHDDGHSIDPDNRLLWRAHRRRLDPESLRDGMLSAAGQLDLASVNSTVWYLGDQATAVGKNEVRRRTDFACRSVYLPVIRNDLPELFESFDFADPHATTGARPETASASQGLFMLNDPTVLDAAEALARRVLKDTSLEGAGARMDRMFELVVNAPPTDRERDALLALVGETQAQWTADASREEADPALRAWTLAGHALFSLSRFQFLE